MNRLRFLFWLGLGLGAVLFVLGAWRPSWLRTRWRLIKLVVTLYVLAVVVLAALEAARRVAG